MKIDSKELYKYFSDFRYLGSTKDPNRIFEFVRYDEVVTLFERIQSCKNMDELIAKLELDLQDIQNLEAKARVGSYEWKVLNNIDSDIRKTIYDMNHLKAHKERQI